MMLFSAIMLWAPLIGIPMAIMLIVGGAATAISTSIAIAKAVKKKKYEAKINAIQEEGELLNQQLTDEYLQKEEDLKKQLDGEISEDTTKIITSAVILITAGAVVWWVAKMKTT